MDVERTCKSNFWALFVLHITFLRGVACSYPKELSVRYFIKYLPLKIHRNCYILSAPENDVIYHLSSYFETEVRLS